MTKVYIDGQFYEKEQAKISVFDHGLLYGDGVFEGIRVYNGKIFKCGEHIDRLYESARAIGIKIPMSKEAMVEAMENTLKANNLVQAYIRLVVTRGVGDLGLDPRLCKKASVIIITDKIQLYPPEIYEKGLELIIASTPRNHQSALSPRIKSLNYLNNIMAKMEGQQANVREVVMLNLEGYVCECSADNIFLVKDGVLKTPAACSGILKGITRDAIIALAEGMEVDVSEENLTRFDLYVADEVFLCGTGAELIAAIKIDGREIGDGKPGPIFKQLLAKFRELASA
jgi:branched-chain amino acid aminotransferase